MIDNVKKFGFGAQRAKYSAAGRLVLDYYNGIKNDYEEAEVIRRMAAKMQEVGFSSAHQDWKKRGAVDFGAKTNDFFGAYAHEVQAIVDAAKKEPKVNANQVFSPSAVYPVIHIEIILNN